MYSDTDIVIKRNIIGQALSAGDEDAALSLCQVDRNSRRACAALDQRSKEALCLRNNESARSCDKVPMFSREQFLALIPPTIEVDVDDDVQYRYEFYSQRYKLPTEGFAEALFKAKVLNTIMAIWRPYDIARYASRFPPLPSNISAYVIDNAVKIFADLDGLDYLKINRGQDYGINIDVTGILPIDLGTSIVNLKFAMNGAWSIEDQELYAVMISLKPPSATKEQIFQHPTYRRLFKDLIDDPYLTDYLNPPVFKYDGQPSNDEFLYIVMSDNFGGRDVPNPFIVSRILYILMKYSLQIEEVIYSTYSGDDTTASALVYHKNKKQGL